MGIRHSLDPHIEIFRRENLADKEDVLQECRFNKVKGSGFGDAR